MTGERTPHDPSRRPRTPYKAWLQRRRARRRRDWLLAAFWVAIAVTLLGTLIAENR